MGELIDQQVNKGSFFPPRLEPGMSETLRIYLTDNDLEAAEYRAVAYGDGHTQWPK